MASPIVSSDFVYLFENRLREVAEEGYNEIPEQRKTFFRDVPSDRAWEEFFSVSGIGDVPEFSNKLTFASKYPGYLSRLEPKEYAWGLEFERKFLDDKQYGVMEDAVKDLGVASGRTMEKKGAEILTNAFSAAFTFLYSEEGLSLCNTAHTTKTGASTSSGFSNSGTSAVNPTSFANTRLTMRRYCDSMGNRIEVDPDMIICPDALRDRFMEITSTPKGLDSAEGTVNMEEKRNWKVVPYMRLDDSDTNNWFMVDSRLMKKYLLWITRVAPDYKFNFDFMTYFTQFSVYFRIACGFTNWRWIYGHQVT